MRLTFDHLAEPGVWSTEDRQARRGKPCQYGGCGIVHLSTYQPRLHMWLCPFHAEKAS